MRKILVVGARSGSLGDAVASQLKSMGIKVVTAGLHTNTEDTYLDALGGVGHAFIHKGYTDVVCTVGRNTETNPDTKNWVSEVSRDLDVNTLGPLRILEEFRKYRPDTGDQGHFVVVSSNSAHVARSNSLGYCASKAAVSMAVRCAGRYMAGEPISVWAVEPGWIDGTPMSRSVEHRLKGHDPHRIPGGKGIGKLETASFIVNGLMDGYRAYNGCTFRLDGGEQ